MCTGAFSFSISRISILKMRVVAIKVHIHVTIQVLACRRVGNLGLQAVLDKAATTLKFVSDDNLQTGIELSFAAEVPHAQGWGDLSGESDTGNGNGGESHDDIAVVTERAGEERRRSTGQSCEEFASVEEQWYDAVGQQRKQQRLPSVKMVGQIYDFD
jgi:hypothetical protein